MFRLVVVDDGDERMKARRTDVLGVVVDVVNFQYLLHDGCKDTRFSSFSVILVEQSVLYLTIYQCFRRTFALS